VAGVLVSILIKIRVRVRVRGLARVGELLNQKGLSFGGFRRPWRLGGRRGFLLRLPFEGVGGKEGGELGQSDRLLRSVDDSFQLGFQAHSSIFNRYFKYGNGRGGGLRGIPAWREFFPRKAAAKMRHGNPGFALDRQWAGKMGHSDVGEGLGLRFT